MGNAGQGRFSDLSGLSPFGLAALSPSAHSGCLGVQGGCTAPALTSPLQEGAGTLPGDHL